MPNRDKYGVHHPASKRWAAIVLSGPVCAGKTTLAWNLAAAIGARPLTTRVLLAARSGESPERLTRRRLQQLGEQFDTREGGQWVADAALALLATDPTGGLTVIDSIRTTPQAHAVHA